MSDTDNQLQYGNNYNHWKILDLVLLILLIFADPRDPIFNSRDLNRVPKTP